jgi:pyruvate/2-oxoglutarate dehydrogenase complex dihydrolipoamide acyltransferase (E2) component
MAAGDADPRYREVPFPAARQIVVDSGRMGARRHLSHGLLEVDVTRPRAWMREHKARTGESLSFTAFIVTCLAQAIARQPEVQAYRNWRGRLVIFSDVDVVTMVETERGGVALPHIIRGADQKTFRQIHDEIRAVQRQPRRSEQTGRLMRWGSRAPRIVRSAFFWTMRKNPHRFKRYSGTTVVTSVGMFGTGAGWVVSFLPMHTLGLAVGGIATRPGFVEGRIEPREVLCLTITFDNDIVDGAPAARFAHDLKELLELGFGLGPGEEPSG